MFEVKGKIFSAFALLCYFGAVWAAACSGTAASCPDEQLPTVEHRLFFTQSLDEAPVQQLHVQLMHRISAAKVCIVLG